MSTIAIIMMYGALEKFHLSPQVGPQQLWELISPVLGKWTSNIPIDSPCQSVIFSVSMFNRGTEWTEHRSLHVNSCSLTYPSSHTFQCLTTQVVQIIKSKGSLHMPPEHCDSLLPLAVAHFHPQLTVLHQENCAQGARGVALILADYYLAQY